MKNKPRCSWCLKDEIYMDYHDNVWGIPNYDDTRLFEFLNLEGAQAGLTWYSILIRTEGYRDAFKNWDAEAIVKMNEKALSKLHSHPGIIKNKLKIKAVKTNAEAFLKIKETSTFSDYIWSFVDGKQIVNNWKSLDQIPASTALSEKMSKDLKSKGFKFVGPTIVYAFMQAVGMVDDHVLSCWKRQ